MAQRVSKIKINRINVFEQYLFLVVLLAFLVGVAILAIHQVQAHNLQQHIRKVLAP